MGPDRGDYLADCSPAGSGIMNIVEDQRIIEFIQLANERFITVGINANLISPYYENDDLWFAIYVGGEIAERINGKFVNRIGYASRL